MVILEIKTGQVPKWINLQTAVPAFLEFDHPDFSYDDENHIYKFNGEEWPSITQLLKHHNLTSNFYTDAGASRGKAAHKIIELYDKGVLDNYEWDQSLKPYLDGWKAFLKSTGWINDKIEVPGFNKDFKLCATMDRMGRFGKSELEPIRRFSLQLKPDGLFKPRRLKEITTSLTDDFNDVKALARVFWMQKEKK